MKKEIKEYAKEIAVAFELRHLQGATRKRMKPETEKEFNQFIKQYRTDD